MSYSAINNDAKLASHFQSPLSPPTLADLLATVPATVLDSLEAYHFVSSSDEVPNLLGPILEEYVSAATAPSPPNNPSKRATACEICCRDWIPLTYHHLIPRQTHVKAVKRGWHEEWRLDSVAWLCRACHSFVHKIASNEELAKEYWTVERLVDRDDVQNWARWVARIRWKAK